MEIATVITPNWIYDFSDYQQMYDLSDHDFSKSIVDFSATISSFNAEATKRHGHVVSIDAAYVLPEQSMRAHAQELLQQTIAQLKASPERLKQCSEKMMQDVIARWTQTEKNFLQDYAKGVAEKRYQPLQLPTLPYKTHEFNLALCTDFIFHHDLSAEKMNAILKELCRIAEAVRIYPLLDSRGKMPESLGPLMLSFQQKNYGVEIREVSYHTLKGGNAMMRIWEQECHL